MKLYPAYTLEVFAAMYVLLLVYALYVALKHEKEIFKLLWSLVVVFIPFGSVLYLFKFVIMHKLKAAV